MEDNSVSKVEEIVIAKHLAEMKSVKDAFVPAVIHHKDMKVSSLEHLQEKPCRYVSDWETYDIDSFISYVNESAKPENCPTVFVSSEKMEANAILDYGKPGEPRFRHDTVVLALEKTPEFKALRQKVDSCSSTSQSDLLDWMETWSDCVTYYDVDDSLVSHNDAERWVKNLTIETAKKQTFEIDQYSEQMSEMEKIEAKSNTGKMVSYLVFNCVPYFGLSAVKVSVKFKVTTSSDKPKFNLMAPKLEIIQRSMSEEFKGIVLDKLGTEIKAYIVK